MGPLEPLNRLLVQSKGDRCHKVTNTNVNLGPQSAFVRFQSLKPGKMKT